MKNTDYKINQHIAELAKTNKLDRLVTVSFTGDNYSSPLRKADVIKTSGIARLYPKKMAEELHGRSRKLNRRPDLWVPMLAIPEFRTDIGEETFLHYHILTRFPPNQAVKLTFATRKFWRERSIRHFDCVPDIQVKHTDDPYRSAFYSMKNIEDGFTVENTIDAALLFQN